MWKQYRDTNYEVSDDGRVRNIKTKKIMKQHYKYNGKKENDYKHITLQIGGKRVKKIVHRMVLETFTYRDDSKEVNHKNLIPDDNRLSNLEYVTREENLEHAFRNSEKIVQRKPVVGVKIGTKEVKGFRSLYMAGKYIGGKGIEEKKIKHYSSAIKNAIIGKINSVGGYYWWFKEDFNFKDVDSMIESKKKPEKYTEEQKTLIEVNNLNISAINRRMKTYRLSLDEALKYKKGHRFAEPVEVKPNPNSKCMQGIGKRFGNLEVLDVVRVKGKKPLYKCKCDCGNIFTTQYTNVLIGKTMSCGCVLKESRLKNLEGREKHGLSGTKIFNVWLGMKERCYNKKSTNYVNYGNRGITVCQEWLDDFMNFYNWAIENGYKEELDKKGRNLLSIDRIDNGKGYSPDNCRWVTNEIQNRNKRTTRFTLEDVEKIEKAGKNTEQVRQRMLKHGLTLDEILKLPKYHRLIPKVKTKILFNVYDLDGGYIKQLDGYEELAEFMGRSVKQMYASICKQAKTKTSRTKNKLDNQWYHVERVGIEYTDKQNEVILDDIKNFVDEV